MRKILFCMIAAAAMTIFYGCQQKNDGKCHIIGTVNGEQYEGKRIFLVPLFGPKTAEYVDSMEIKDGKFEFSPDTVQMYKILLDYHYRFGLQPLLVVGEPGEVQVSIDTISHATGTPLNDALDQWKIRTEQHNQQLVLMRRQVESLKKAGNQAQSDYMKQRADSFHLVYKQYTRDLAKSVEGTTLGDFLKELYPLTYKRKYPDGRIVTLNADTNEEIPE